MNTFEWGKNNMKVFAGTPCNNSLLGRGVVLRRTGECLTRRSGQCALAVLRRVCC